MRPEPFPTGSWTNPFWYPGFTFAIASRGARPWGTGAVDGEIDQGGVRLEHWGIDSEILEVHSRRVQDKNQVRCRESRIGGLTAMVLVLVGRRYVPCGCLWWPLLWIQVVSLAALSRSAGVDYRICQELPDIGHAHPRDNEYQAGVFCLKTQCIISFH